MKKLSSMLIPILLTLPIFCFSWASFTGNRVLDYCSKALLFYQTKNYNYLPDANFCSGYIAGVASAMLQSLPSNQVDCYTEQYKDVTQEQLTRVAVKILRDYPRYLDYDASGSLVAVFWRDFPMPKQCLRSTKAR